MNPISCACLRPKDAASYLSLSRQRLAKLRLEGGGPPYSKIGRSVIYRLEDLDRWITANRRLSTSDEGAGARP